MRIIFRNNLMLIFNSLLLIFKDLSMCIFMIIFEDYEEFMKLGNYLLDIFLTVINFFVRKIEFRLIY